MESDPIGLNGGENTYAYADLNPLTKIDRLGLCQPGDVMCEIAMQQAGLPQFATTDEPQPSLKCEAGETLGSTLLCNGLTLADPFIGGACDAITFLGSLAADPCKPTAVTPPPTSETPPCQTHKGTGSN